MLEKILAKLLRDSADKLDSGNCELSAEDTLNMLESIAKFDPDYRMSKDQACTYLGMSRSSFDNHVKIGRIPKGLKIRGFKELSWPKHLLDLFIYELKNLLETGDNII